MPLDQSFPNNPHEVPHKPYAVVTGGSSGIGYQIARLLLARGTSVSLVARRPALVAEAAATLRASANLPAALKTIVCDVSDPQAVKSAFDTLIAEYGSPAALYNCAGIALPGEFLDLQPEDFERLMRINYLGTVYPTQICAKAMVAAGGGHIINCASVAGFVGLYGYTAYGPSKYAVRGFSDALRAEMKQFGIKVSVVFPPDTQTPQLEEEDKLKPPITRVISGQSKVLTAVEVAEAVLRGVDRGSYLILPGSETRMMFLLSNLLGGKVYPLMDWLVNSARKKLAAK